MQQTSSVAQPQAPLVRRVVEASPSGPWGLLRPGRFVAAVAGDLRELSLFRSVLANFVRGQLLVRYQRSFLGFGWTLLNPILMMTVLAIFFSELMGRDLKTYTVYLFAGLLPWQFISGAISNGAGSLIQSEQIIRKIYVPKLLFPLSTLLVAAVNMMFAMVALFILLLFFGARVSPQLALLPAALGLLVLYGFGLSLAMMVLNTFFRDLNHMLDVLLRVWYFASPILYDLGKKSSVGYTILQFNPLTHLLNLFHCALAQDSAGKVGEAASFGWPTGYTWGMSVGMTLGTLLIGYAVYKMTEHKLIFRL